VNWPKLVHSVRSAAVFFVLAISLPAQKLSFLRSVDAGSSTTPGIATDRTGVYMVSLSGKRFVLRKFDPGGNELWTSESGEAQWITAMIAVAEDGIYITGSVDGAAPGQTGAGSWDTYLARYDTAGKQLWMRQFGTSGDEEGGGMAADTSGVYVASATWIFAKQSYVASLRKYSPEGNLLWTRDFTGLSHWRIPLAADGASLYLATGAGLGGKPWSNGQPAFPFLRKYTRDGIEQWTQQFPAQPAGISGLAVDHSGVYAVLESFAASGNISSIRKYDTDANEHTQPQATNAHAARGETAAPEPSTDRTSARTALPALPALAPDPTFVDRVTEGVLRRIDRRLRIERERRGL